MKEFEAKLDAAQGSPEQARPVEGAPDGCDLYIVSYTGEHRGERVAFDRAVEELRNPQTATWMHVVVHNREAGYRLLVKTLGFHPVAAEDALTEGERPELKEFDDHVFFVLPAVVPKPGGELRFIEVGFFLRGNGLVTVAEETVPTLAKWHDRLIQRARLRDAGAAFLMHAVADALIDDYFPIVDELEDQVDELSEQIYREHEGSVRELIRLKHRHLALRRRLSPTREVFNALQRRDLEIIPDGLRPYLQDVYTNIIRMIEAIDMNRDSLSNLFDIRLSVTNNRLNIVVQRMTTISTVLMICALVASIYGMNFKHMPELDWRYGYPFALGLMVVGSLVALYFFRRNKWI